MKRDLRIPPRASAGVSHIGKHTTATIWLACLLVSSPSAAAAELHGQMHGLVWRVGKYLAQVSLTDFQPVPYSRGFPAFDDPEEDRAETGRIARRIDEVLAREEEIKGLFIYATWEELEPQDGVYDWDFLDRVTRVAAKNGVFYKLSLNSGYRSPEWLYAKGVKSFTTVNSKERKMMPIPWDETYLKHFTRLQQKVSERYSDDKNFYAVTLTGASTRGGEMYLMHSTKDKERWAACDPDYRVRVTETYKYLIDSFVGTFPHQQLCVHISSVVPGTWDETEAVVEYGVNEYPDRFTLQNCQLHGRNDNAGNRGYQMILQHKSMVHNGFQTCRSFMMRPDDAGSMKQMILNYIRVDSEYCEVGWCLQFPFFVNQFVEELQLAKSLGYEKYRAVLDDADLLRTN